MKRPWDRGNRICLSSTGSGGSCMSTSRWWMLWWVSWEQKEEKPSAGQHLNCTLKTLHWADDDRIVCTAFHRQEDEESISRTLVELLDRESQSPVFMQGISYCLFRVADLGLVGAAKVLLRYGADLSFEGAEMLKTNTWWFCDSDKPHYHLETFCYCSRPCVVLQPLTYCSVEEQTRHGADVDISWSWNQQEGQGEKNTCLIK